MPRKKRTRRRAGTGRRGRPSALQSVSTADLHAEMQRRAERVGDLQRRRADLAAELATLDRELQVYGIAAGAPRRRGRPPRALSALAAPSAAPARKKTKKKGRVGRPRKTGSGRRGNKLSLVEALHATLQGKTMGVAEVSDAVQKAGYKTTSPNFRTIVNQALIANPSKFRKVSRGQYTAK